ncbi:hypothetical protein TIFTF001_023460 [Ficus carica]|uniref:Peptidase S54 rhomboid domain-containing protein n=1 Tax=Ficus carica TaxID=3494 RepID=A0AA88AEQ7_FICCA|nr:hypothetical protein TIFTF001_023460 [Ficus carica]
MQRLVSLRIASNLTRKLSDTKTTTSHKAFASLTKPGQTQTHSQTHFLTHSWRSQTTLSSPLLAKRLLDCSSNSLLKRGVADFRVGFRGTQFAQRSFKLDPSFRSFQQRSSWRSWLRGLSPNDVVIGLIVTNVAVFLLWRVADYRFMIKNFTLGQVFGPEFILKLYLAGGLAGSVFYLAHSAFLASSSKGQLWKDPLRTPGLGASGAVNAIVLLDIFLFPRSTLYFNFFIPIPAILLGIYLIGKDVLGIIEGQTPGSAHLGGAMVAAVAWARLRRGRF